MDRPRNTTCRYSREDLEFGQQVASVFHESLGLPLDCCETAAATCRFELRGLNANGNEWGLGVVTNMTTQGNIPDQVGGIGQPAVQVQRNVISLTDDDAADVILGCFGLSMDDVYKCFGQPIEGERINVKLRAIVSALAPAFLKSAAAA